MSPYCGCRGTDPEGASDGDPVRRDDVVEGHGIECNVSRQPHGLGDCRCGSGDRLSEFRHPHTPDSLVMLSQSIQRNHDSQVFGPRTLTSHGQGVRSPRPSGAYASTDHDVRWSGECILGWIERCRPARSHGRIFLSFGSCRGVRADAHEHGEGADAAIKGRTLPAKQMAGLPARKRRASPRPIRTSPRQKDGG